MIYTCADCGEIVAEYECDEYGVPVEAIFDDADIHLCNEPDE